MSGLIYAGLAKLLSLPAFCRPWDPSSTDIVENAAARDEAEEGQQHDLETGPAALVPNRLANFTPLKKYFWKLEEDRFLLENYVK